MQILWCGISTRTITADVCSAAPRTTGGCFIYSALYTASDDRDRRHVSCAAESLPGSPIRVGRTAGWRILNRESHARCCRGYRTDAGASCDLVRRSGKFPGSVVDDLASCITTIVPFVPDLCSEPPVSEPDQAASFLRRRRAPAAVFQRRCSQKYCSGAWRISCSRAEVNRCVRRDSPSAP